MKVKGIKLLIGMITIEQNIDKRGNSYIFR